MDPSSSTIETATTAALASAAQAAASGDAAARAFAELAAVLGEIEAGYIVPDRKMHTPQDRAAGRYLVAKIPLTPKARPKPKRGSTPRPKPPLPLQIRHSTTRNFGIQNP